MIRPLLFLTIFFVLTASAAQYTNSTSVACHTSFTNSALAPGDTIWVRAGTYTPPYTNSGTFGELTWTVNLTGATNNLITIRSYPGELAKFDLQWRFGTSTFLRFRDLEFYDSRRGLHPTNGLPNGGKGPWAHFDGNAAGNLGYHVWINCIIHDVHNGLSGSAPGDVMRGCITWHTGVSRLEHLVYNTPTIFSGNIVAWNIEDPLNLISWSTTALVKSNIIFGTGQTLPAESSGGTDMSFTGNSVVSTVILLNNYTYNKWSAQHGSSAMKVDNSNVWLSNNVFVAGYPLWFSGAFTNVNVHSNVFVMNDAVNFGVIRRDSNTGTWAFNGNKYYAPSPFTVKFETNNTYINFTEWKATFAGYDTTSTATDAGLPADAVYVIPNEDEAKRAHVAVYNWSGASTATVSLAGVLVSGDAYQLYSAQNYGTAIASGTYNGTSISVPMTGLTVAPRLYGPAVNPYGATLLDPPATSPEFAAFVVQGAAAVALPGATVNVGTLYVR